MFGCKRDEVTGEWRRLRKEKLYDSGDRTEKNEICRTCGTRGGTGVVQEDLVGGKLREESHLEGLGVDGRIILKLISETWVGRHRLDRCLRIGTTV
jgi:hypothetical protein